MHAGRCCRSTEFEIKASVISHNRKVYSHLVWRRFVDFLELQEHLRTHDCFSSSQLPELSPRHWLRSKLSPKFLEERFLQLRKFVQEVIMLDPYLRCEALRDFLDLEMHLDVVGSHITPRSAEQSRIGSVSGNMFFLSALSQRGSEIRDTHGHSSVFLSKSNHLDTILDVEAAANAALNGMVGEVTKSGVRVHLLSQ